MNEKEIARKALMQLAARKLLPTPANYLTVFNEIAGTPNTAPFPDEALRAIAQALPDNTPKQHKLIELLYQAIDRSNWKGVQKALVACASAEAASPAPDNFSAANLGDNGLPDKIAPGLPLDFLDQLARLIENALPAIGTDNARFAEQVEQLLGALRAPSPGIPTVRDLLDNFSHSLMFVAEDQAEIRTTLLNLLHLIISNIGELNQDNDWLKRQIETAMVAAAPPLTLRRLDDLERRLKDVMFKQIEAKGRTLDAQAQMRQLLATFIERLALMTESTSTYHNKMEKSARLLERAKSIEEIAPVLKEVINATRGIVHETRNMRDELRDMREKTSTTQAEVARLHQELNKLSAEARHDSLTGALNRKGLDEALSREFADVQRKETPLCIALLDVDNFKKLNDTLGHDTGDAALTHLATVTRDSLRTQDTLARYGGEEFVILMPDTVLDAGIDAMKRLQRALTKRFFLADNEKILITFSAGVAQLAPGEIAEDAIKRADQAMYLAKRAGKNRVLGA